MPYDSWKLATPPEYEITPEEEAELWLREIDDRIDELSQDAETPAQWAEIMELIAQRDGTQWPPEAYRAYGWSFANAIAPAKEEIVF